jgi:hypothetical protein
VRRRIALLDQPQMVAAAAVTNGRSTDGDEETRARVARVRKQVAEDMSVAGIAEGKDRAPRRPQRGELDDLLANVYSRRQSGGKIQKAAPEAAPVQYEALSGSRGDEESEVAYYSEGSRARADRARVTLASKSLAQRAGREPSSPLASAPGISSGPRPVHVPLALYDRPPPSEPHLSDPYLPAVSAGGFDFVYQAPATAAVPSSGKEIRIPLAAQAFQTAVYYEATPALATTAFLRARVRNDGRRPLLRGPAAIFGDGELVGVGEIQTTGPSGDIELPLGADQDIRLVRQVVPATKTTGLIFKTDETTYDVQIQVGNYKKQPVSVEVTDQVPRSRNEKVEVKVLGTDPRPTGDVDIDGSVRFRLDVAPGATRTIKLRYQISRPHDWELYQR